MCGVTTVSPKSGSTPWNCHSSGNFRMRELRRILRIVERNQAQLLEDWNDYFDG